MINLSPKLTLIVPLTSALYLIPFSALAVQSIPEMAEPTTEIAILNSELYPVEVHETRDLLERPLVAQENIRSARDSQVIDASLPLSIEGELNSGDEILELRRRDEVVIFSSDNSFSDTYPFEGKAGQSILISMESNEVDSYLFLLDKNKSVIAANDDYSDGTTQNSRLAYILPEDGIYHIVASTYSPQEEGFYKITIRNLDDSNLQLSDANQFTVWGNEEYRESNFNNAIRFYERALEIYTLLGSSSGEVDALLGLGLINGLLGNYPQALSLYERGLEISQGIDGPYGGASILQNIGGLYLRTEDFSEALKYFEQSLSAFINNSDGSGIATSLTNIGNIYAEQENWSKALEYYEQSLDIARRIDYDWLEAQNLGNIANVYALQENYTHALGLLDQSLVIFRRAGSRAHVAQVLGLKATIYQLSGQLVQSEQQFYEALTRLEALRSEDLADNYQVTLFELHRSTYTKLQQVLIEQYKYERALEISERARARAFIKLLSNRLSLQNATELASAPPELAVIKEIARENQSFFVEYSVVNSGIGEPMLYIWVVSPEGEIEFESVSLQGVNLLELVTQTRRAIGTRGRGGLEAESSEETASEEQREKLSDLHSLLIEPISAHLPSNSTIPVVFIPQNELFMVPFAALINDEGEHLIQNHTILTAPSIQVLEITQRQAIATNNSGAATEILTLGNPVMPAIWNTKTEVVTQLTSLPGAEQEAKVIANFFGTEALIGAQATEQAVKQQIENARIVHLATHGLLEYGIPEESGVRDVPGAIALTPTETEDGLLTSAEILELDLKAELVVLSACDTGLGTITGDGVIGLSRSLIAAGASSVIVSLWSIPDAPTAELMTEFYRQRQQGQDKAQALRQAMLITMETHPNPRDWAAFTLIGEAN